MIAPKTAKPKVNAIGRNILPSTPVKKRMGVNTMSMINWPKKAEFIIVLPES